MIISHLLMLMWFSTVRKFRILSPVNIINCFTHDQHWDLLGQWKTERGWSSEFYLGVYVNKKNCIVWAEKSYTWSYRSQCILYNRYRQCRRISYHDNRYSLLKRKLMELNTVLWGWPRNNIPRIVLHNKKPKKLKLLKT